MQTAKFRRNQYWCGRAKWNSSRRKLFRRSPVYIHLMFVTYVLEGWKNSTQTNSGDDQCSQVKILCSSYSPLKITRKAKLTFPMCCRLYLVSISLLALQEKDYDENSIFSVRMKHDEQVDFQ